MPWAEESSSSLRGRVALVEEVYERLVVSLKEKVNSLEEELVGVKDRMEKMQETMQRQPENEDLPASKRHVPGEPDLNRTALLRMRAFLNQSEDFHSTPTPEVIGATVAQTDSSDSLFSDIHADSPETPSERPPFMNHEFLKQLGDMLLRRQTTSLNAPHPVATPQHPPHHATPHYSSVHSQPPHRFFRATPHPLPRPPPPPSPPPTLPPSPPVASFPRSYRSSHLPPAARHASASATPIPPTLLGCLKRYCLVTQGSGTGGLYFFNDDKSVRLKTRRQDHVYQFDRVFRTDMDADTMPEALKNDISKLVSGKEVCVVAFGHSYTGKTRLVLGRRRKDGAAGLLGKAAKKIIKASQTLKNTALKISACEVFSGETRDLLRDQGAGERADASWDARPATWVDLTSMADVRLLTRIIWDRRRTRADCWPPSSASHLLLTLTVVQRGDVVGRLVVADLAGFRTHGTKTRREADQYINFSLKDLVFALGGYTYDRTGLLLQLLEDFLLDPQIGVHVFCCLGRWEGQQDANYLTLHYFGN
ncbi:Kinesin-2 [Portunus trituberculatus]|uniref:Kinesin-2 n=1 Tax=Portunus trituberculatus TaxID=210409 RepID=A0A5B7FFJ0_PORTR|nr:Kinesin-2 [Portunus trituberculatus]